MQALASLKATPARAAQQAGVGEGRDALPAGRRALSRRAGTATTRCSPSATSIGRWAAASSAGYDDDAVQAYRRLVAEYPSSSLGEKALFNVVEIARADGDRKEIARRGSRVPGRLPRLAARGRGQGRGEEGRQDRRRRPCRRLRRAGWPRSSTCASGAAPAPPASCSTSRSAVHYKYDRISNPDRLWVDLEGTRLHPNLLGKIFPVGDGLLEKIRIGQNKDSTVRVVLDFKDVKDHTIFYLENPTRLVVDVRGAAAPPATVIAGRPPATVVGDERVSGAASTCRPIVPLPRACRPGPGRASPPRRRCPCAASMGWRSRGSCPRPSPIP